MTRFPKTKEERKQFGTKWIISYTKGHCDGTDAELQIFDKSGGVRAKLKLDKDDLEQIRRAIDGALGAE